VPASAGARSFSDDNVTIEPEDEEAMKGAAAAHYVTMVTRFL
jgi:hypothetical protein